MIFLCVRIYKILDQSYFPFQNPMYFLSIRYVIDDAATIWTSSDGTHTHISYRSDKEEELIADNFLEIFSTILLFPIQNIRLASRKFSKRYRNVISNATTRWFSSINWYLFELSSIRTIKTVILSFLFYFFHSKKFQQSACSIIEFSQCLCCSLGQINRLLCDDKKLLFLHFETIAIRFRFDLHFSYFHRLCSINLNKHWFISLRKTKRKTDIEDWIDWIPVMNQ